MTINVAIIDSGAGGLSILNAIRNQMPQLNLYYYADSKYAPYGDKPSSFLQSRIRNIGVYLSSLETPIHAIVVACNTATVEAIDVLREVVSIPVIGVEPAVKPALIDPLVNRVSVLATPVTTQSERLQELLSLWKEDKHVDLIASDSLAQLIDNADLSSEGALSLEVARICDKVQMLRSDVLVLACTHYPLVKRMFEERLLGVAILEPSMGVTDQLLWRLHEVASANHISTGNPFGQKVDCGSKEECCWLREMPLGRVTLHSSGSETSLGSLRYWCEDKSAISGKTYLSFHDTAPF
ncbi:glutamate racemase [Marinomonas balearica]|uniref:Glutamate racemase n=1 Tax=Marinomonas balearica TaxID=491947 RepID=A0A4R6M688_9GAMM|nr:glutamate racemase [Marinomonas balearica]TDO96888.1 glutamate racemase [Marinomonas balearica]